MQQLKKLIDPAFVMALRGCLALTAGMLFTLVPAPLGADGYHYPDPSAVFITCALVNFQPDLASSIKKSIERCGGTIVGCSVGIAIGFISLEIGAGTTGQAAFLGVILSILFFALPYYVAKTKTEHIYAYGLGMMSGGLIAMGFYNAFSKGPWLYALERTAGLLLGCCISLVISAVVLPQPMEVIIDRQLKMSMRNMGKAIRMILEAAGNDSGGGEGSKLPLITELISDDEKHDYDEDEIHNAYSKAANLHAMGKARLPLLKYDPFLLWSRGFDKKKIALYGKQVQMQRVRLNRLITSVLSMDSLFRMGIQEVDMAKFNLCDTLVETGKRLEVVLDMEGGTTDERNEAAHLLLVENLASIRQVRMNIKVPTRDDAAYTRDIEDLLKGQALLSAFFSDEDAICFFLRHVEVVIMSCVRLHYCFQEEVSTNENDREGRGESSVKHDRSCDHVEGEGVDECAA